MISHDHRNLRRSNGWFCLICRRPMAEVPHSAARINTICCPECQHDPEAQEYLRKEAEALHRDPYREPPRPTTARPGSQEKLRCMCWRAENGFRLHHRRDRKE